MSSFDGWLGTGNDAAEWQRVKSAATGVGLGAVIGRLAAGVRAALVGSL